MKFFPQVHANRPLTATQLSTTVVPSAVDWLNSTNTEYRMLYLPWDRIEPVHRNSPVYQWDAQIDANIDYWKHQGYRVILGLFGTPEWARYDLWKQYRNSQPIGWYTGRAARFMEEAVARYDVSDVIIWNEPDVAPEDSMPEHFGGWGNPRAQYYGAGNYAAFVDYLAFDLRKYFPGTTIHVPGMLNESPPVYGLPQDQFIIGLIRALRKPYQVDFWGIHAYTWWGDFSENTQDKVDFDVNLPGRHHWDGQGVIQGKADLYRRLLKQYADGSHIPQLMVTEMALARGGGSCDTPGFQVDKANYVWRSFMRALKMDTIPWWYELEESWQCVGLFGTPSALTYKFMDQFHGWDFYAFLDHGGVVFEDYILRRWHNGKFQYAAIMFSNYADQTRLHPGWVEIVDWFDMYGNPIAPDRPNSQYNIGYEPRIAIAKP